MPQKYKHPRQVIVGSTFLTSDDRDALERRRAQREGRVYVPKEVVEETHAVSSGNKEHVTCIDRDASPPSESLCRTMAFLQDFTFDGMACEGECKAKKILRNATLFDAWLRGSNQ